MDPIAESPPAVAPTVCCSRWKICGIASYPRSRSSPRIVGFILAGRLRPRAQLPQQGRASYKPWSTPFGSAFPASVIALTAYPATKPIRTRAG